MMCLRLAMQYHNLLEVELWQVSISITGNVTATEGMTSRSEDVFNNRRIQISELLQMILIEGIAFIIKRNR